MTDGALLKVDSLAVRYGRSIAVGALSCELGAGKCLGVIGESGAGKTQGFLALMGLLPANATVSGSARLSGEDMLSAAATKLRGRRVAMIFQDPMTALTPHMRIGAQVAEPLLAHRGLQRDAAQRQAAELLRQVRISDVERRMQQYPHELSGGMRQRVMIAMALACDPVLLIADEPTTALDVSVQAQVLSLLRELVRARNMALVVITHDMGVIASLADDVIVMRQGEVIERGRVEQILATPSHEYTRSLLAATPRMDLPGPPVSQPPDANAADPLVVRDIVVRHAVHQGWLRRASKMTAVDGVSLNLRDGEALGLVGESGCGKSTLVRSLLRLGPMSGGRVVWLGRAIESLRGEDLRQLRAGMQVVFQDPFASLDPRMTVQEIVAEPLRALCPGLDGAQRSARVEAALNSVGLGTEHARRLSRELSGGQCQRVAIARAMVLEPKLLVCDEAVSALDVSVQAQILELLAGIKRSRGTSILFVSHNLAVVRKLCERVLVMYLGRIVEDGPTEEVFSSPRHPYTRMLLDAVPLLDVAKQRARLDAQSGTTDSPSALERPDGCAFRLRCPAAADICRQASPEPQDAGVSLKVACHRWRELTKSP